MHLLLSASPGLLGMWSSPLNKEAVWWDWGCLAKATTKLATRAPYGSEEGEPSTAWARSLQGHQMLRRDSCPHWARASLPPSGPVWTTRFSPSLTSSADQMVTAFPLPKAMFYSEVKLEKIFLLLIMFTLKNFNEEAQSLVRKLQKCSPNFS